MVKILYIITMKSSDSGASFPHSPEFCSPPEKNSYLHHWFVVQAMRSVCCVFVQYSGGYSR